ncbi:hypothetical protein MED222_05130 [Vibrio sp. MED222]|nr:hypothetical protein MED222_05130 [Vibrio sp. MED222]
MRERGRKTNCVSMVSMWSNISKIMALQ